MTTEKRIELAAIFAARYIQESHDIHADAYKRAQVCRAALAWADALAEIAGQDKPKTRYDWSIAPGWAKYAATDKNGNKHWYSGKPSCVEYDEWMLTDDLDDYAMFEESKTPCKENWKMTLEARPNA